MSEQGVLTVEPESGGEKLTRRQVALNLLSTHDIQLEWTNSLTVLPSTGEIIAHGPVEERAEGSGKYAFHVYTPAGEGLSNARQGQATAIDRVITTSEEGLSIRSGEGRNINAKRLIQPVGEGLKYRTMKATCKHEGVELVAVTVGTREFISVSCPGCKDIKLLNLRTGETTVAFQNNEFTPDLMCLGENGQMFVTSLGDCFPVVELDSTKAPFPNPIRNITTGIESWCSGMCYLPAPQKAIVLSIASKSIIRAVSADNNNILWEVSGEIDGIKCNPWGPLFCPQHRVLLVGDGDNHRLLVLDPSDGSHRQTISFPETFGGIYDLFLHCDQIIMHHWAQLSYLSIY